MAAHRSCFVELREYELLATRAVLLVGCHAPLCYLSASSLDHFLFGDIEAVGPSRAQVREAHPGDRNAVGPRIDEPERRRLANCRKGTALLDADWLAWGIPHR